MSDGGWDVELSPGRAKIFSSPEEYRFSSYRYYAYGIPDALVSPSPAYLSLSLKKAEENNILSS